jgi:hypothetical protein
MSEGDCGIGISNKNARGQNGCSVFGRFCLPDSGRRYWKTRVSDRVASLRSIPQQGPHLLSALQVPCEELSCDYLALFRTVECRQRRRCHLSIPTPLLCRTASTAFLRSAPLYSLFISVSLRLSRSGCRSGSEEVTWPKRVERRASFSAA